MNRNYSVKSDGQIVGRASVVERDGASVITIISVDKKYRKLGLGRKLMNKVIEKEFQHNDTIRLECRPNPGMEDRVRAWYERLGFVSTGEGNWMELKKA